MKLALFRRKQNPYLILLPLPSQTHRRPPRTPMKGPTYAPPIKTSQMYQFLPHGKFVVINGYQKVSDLISVFHEEGIRC